MNLDDMARSAMSRVSYAIAANAEWEKKKIAQGFAELRKANEPQITGTTSVSQVLSAQDLFRLALQNAHPNTGLRMYANQAASWNTSNLLNSILGGAV